MRLIDGDYLYNKLVANKCPYDLVLQMVKDEPTVCDIEQIKDIQKWERVVSKAEVLEQIRAEIEETIGSYVCDKEENTIKAQGMLNAMQMTFEIIDKYSK